MDRTIISLPISPDSAKFAASLAKDQGKNRTEYLRDVVEGHIRMARFRRIQEIAEKNRRPDWPQTEEEVVALVRQVRKEMANEKRSKA